MCQRIKDGWQKKNVVSVLLDISQPFPTVSHVWASDAHEPLLHIMRKRRLPVEIVNWTCSFLTGRKTMLVFDDYISTLLDASTGIPQGSSFSPTLYLFYSADLLDLINPQDKDQASMGYIDDTGLLMLSPTVQSNVRLIESFASKAEDREATHACRLDVPKFQLCHFI